MKKTETEIKEIVQDAVNQNNILSMKTYLLSDYGENILKIIASTILEKFNRIDLMEISYSSAKELVINATKANLKRVMYKELGLDITNPDDYNKGLDQFKDNLTEDKISTYKHFFKKYDLPVTATFYYTKDVLNIKVFFMEYGDSTEGAGMGITMVGILLDQSGISKHSFSLYSSDKYQETVAKIEIPLHDDYISKREMFQRELKEKGITAEEFRKSFSYNYKQFGKLNQD